MLVSNIVTNNKFNNLNAPPVGSNSFIFKIDKECMTSAGVYSRDKRLVRTLWSGKKYEAGTYTEQWDGKDDEGNLALGGNYDITILSNNMRYEWEGVIGNTSDKFTGNTVYNNNSPICTMAIAGGTAYFANGYNEQKSSQQKFNIANSQKKIPIVVDKPAHSSYYVATDGKIVYWAGTDAEQKWFVFGTAVADDSFINFEKGTNVIAKFGRTYNAIDNFIGKESAISGLAVQKKGNYLFVAHKILNQVHILDKYTGAMLQTIPVKQPSLLAIDGNDNIWLLYEDNKIEKFSVEKNGTLLSLNIRIENLPDVQALAVSPDGGYVLTVLGGDSQQVKAFTASNGKLLWAFGQEGGYSRSSEARDDKFYFTDKRKPRGKCFLCFAQDGSFWVGDTGNYRVLHYNSDRKLIEQIMYVPTCYSCTADANNPTRVFADYLEFEIDYSKPLSPANQSWKLVRNWGGSVPDNMDNQYLRLKCVTTLSNKRTYALLFGKERKWELAELGQNNQLRFTGIQLSQNTQLYSDGSLRSISDPHIGSPTTFSIQKLSGFDTDGNPKWDSEEIIAVSPVNSNKEPLYKGNLPTLRTGEITDSGVVVSFDASKNNDGWHLGGIKKGDKRWLWRTAFSTTHGYIGVFPSNGYFDIGNGVKIAGSIAIASGNHIFWGYHGEFWKGSQTNKWNHVYENGLFVNQFGTTAPEWPKGTYPAGMAGNAVSAIVVKADNGNLYLYHNDENYHGGIHRWKLDGFDTIKEQLISLSVSAIDQGLLGTYFKSNDLNNLAITSVVRDNAIDFPSLPLGSIRWEGFIKPPFVEEFTFYLTINGHARLWINDELKIDKWENVSANTFTATHLFKGQTIIAIKIETANSGSINLTWSSASQQKQTITKKNFIPAVNNTSLNKFDLLEGLSGSGESFLENNLYGWQRNPAQEDHTDKYRQWWSVRTNVKTYGLQKGADLQINLKTRNASATVTRDIALPRPLTAWNLTGNFDFTGNVANNGKNDGLFFDIVDKNEKIIARLYFVKQDSEVFLYGNTVVIAKDDVQTKLKQFNKNLPISITVEKQKASFAIAGFKQVSDSIFDNEADWRSPDKIRIQLMEGSTNNSSAERTVNIESLVYSIT